MGMCLAGGGGGETTFAQKIDQLPRILEWVKLGTYRDK